MSTILMAQLGYGEKTQSVNVYKEEVKELIILKTFNYIATFTLFFVHNIFRPFLP